MLLAVIAACEIGFWVLLAAGLVTRYLVIDAIVSFSYSFDRAEEKPRERQSA